MNLNELTIKEARLKLDSGEISSLDLTRACLKKIKEIDAEIHACLTVCELEAEAEAKAADKRIKAGERGDLLGIPYLCKDILMTKGIRTTAASKILENYIAPYDATAVAKLKAAGAVMLGKTNLDEFAHGASTENSAFGPTKNPYDLSRVAGGSSGGSAAAVAANMCLFALGTDTGGSIRCPASFCGVVGLKPSYGRVSRFGLLSMTSSTDVVGPLTKTVYDAALVLKAIAGDDDRDATTASEAIEAYEKEVVFSKEIISEKEAVSNKETISEKEIISNKKAVFKKEPIFKEAVLKDKPLKGIKVGLPEEYYLKDLNKDVAAHLTTVAKKLEAAGAELVKVSLPYTKYGIPVYYIIMPSEVSSNLARFDGIGWGLAKTETANLQEFYKTTRGAGFGPEAKRRLILGTYALSAGYYDAYYKKAQAVRTLIIKDFINAFQKVDILLTPTEPHPAFKIGEKINDPLAMYLEDIFVTGASLAGLPAISVPAGTVEVEDGKQMPIGAQLIGPRLKEGLIIKVASVLE